jgi:hypothetical protein
MARRRPMAGNMELSSSTPPTSNPTHKILPAKSHDTSSTNQKIPKYNNSTHTTANKQNQTILFFSVRTQLLLGPKPNTITVQLRKIRTPKIQKKKTKNTKNTKFRWTTIDQTIPPSQITPHHPKE